jgi:hypothetical protein
VIADRSETPIHHVALHEEDDVSILGIRHESVHAKPVAIRKRDEIIDEPVNPWVKFDAG